MDRLLISRQFFIDTDGSVKSQLVYSDSVTIVDLTALVECGMLYREYLASLSLSAQLGIKEGIDPDNISPRLHIDI